jgi:hypothetical protein
MYATSTQFLTTMSEPQQSKNSVPLNVMALVKLPQTAETPQQSQQVYLRRS